MNDSIMKLHPGNAQWIGRRAEQQDAFGFAGFDQAYFLAHGGVLAVLADGMGGMSNGREASRSAVQCMLASYREKRPDESIPGVLMRGLAAANTAVYDLACSSDGEGNVGTTLVAAAVRGEQLFWVAAGDSRLYLYRGADGSLTQCTQDHNYGNELLLQVAAGELSRDEVESHPDREALTSFLGMAEIPKVDCNLQPLPLAPGDRLLLCSDGIYSVLSEAEMKQLLATDAQPAADALIAAVNAKAMQTQDNATAVVLACQAENSEAAGGGRRAKRSMKPVSLALVGILLALALALGLSHWRDPAFRLLGFRQAPDTVARDTVPAAAPPRQPPASDTPATVPAIEEPSATPSLPRAQAKSPPPVDAVPESAEGRDAESSELQSFPEEKKEGEEDPRALERDPSTMDPEVPQPFGAARQGSGQQEAGTSPTGAAPVPAQRPLSHELLIFFRTQRFPC
jgi:serine/threonine protein phosphatase PrpC